MIEDAVVSASQREEGEVFGSAEGQLELGKGTFRCRG